MPSPKIVVFAYHNVGVRCLQVLQHYAANIALVITHRDSPTENIWYQSVYETASFNDLPVVYTEDYDDDALEKMVGELHPDFIFSFYYRKMLPLSLLAKAKQGAFNMHGSLLPHYRGRVPVNWAIINGETQTGATLHVMVEKPDAGDIVGQLAVPILNSDEASDVFSKVTVAAEQVLFEHFPKIIAGNYSRQVQNLSEGSYFGGRKPADGQINWTQTAAQIANLVRSLAPPYPPAFFDWQGQHIQVLKCKVINSADAAALPSDSSIGLPIITSKGLMVKCADDKTLLLAKLAIDGRILSAEQYTQLLN